MVRASVVRADGMRSVLFATRAFGWSRNRPRSHRRRAVPPPDAPRAAPARRSYGMTRQRTVVTSRLDASLGVWARRAEAPVRRQGALPDSPPSARCTNAHHPSRAGPGTPPSRTPSGGSAAPASPDSPHVSSCEARVQATPAILHWSPAPDQQLPQIGYGDLLPQLRGVGEPPAPFRLEQGAPAAPSPSASPQPAAPSPSASGSPAATASASASAAATVAATPPVTPTASATGSPSAAATAPSTATPSAPAPSPPAHAPSSDAPTASGGSGTDGSQPQPQPSEQSPPAAAGRAPDHAHPLPLPAAHQHQYLEATPRWGDGAQLSGGAVMAGAVLVVAVAAISAARRAASRARDDGRLRGHGAAGADTLGLHP